MTSPARSRETPQRSGRAGEEVGTTVERFEVTLDGLRLLRRRIDHKQLDPDDWPLVGALVSKQIARAEGRQERMIAKRRRRGGEGREWPGPRRRRLGPRW